MNQVKQKVQKFEKQLTENPETLELDKLHDIYFEWSKEACEKADINPKVRKVIHAGLDQNQEVAGLTETAKLYDELTEDADIYVLEDGETAEGRQPLMMVEGPAQQLFTPETSVLGTLSYYLTEANEDVEHVEPEVYGKGFEEAAELVEDFEQTTGLEILFADFGARHYHPVQQDELAVEAFKNGAEGHSTKKGVEAINKYLEAQNRADEKLQPSGTMNHAYVLTHAEQGLEDATFEAFKNYDDFFNEDVETAEDENYTPVPLLLDTNNEEADEALRACNYMEQEYGEEFEIVVRIDTNGANHAQTIPEEERTPENKGVSPEAIRGFAEEMKEAGYRDNMVFSISSGMGKTEKLAEVLEEAEDYYQQHGEAMFNAIGAGSFNGCNNLYTTSDIVTVNGKPRGKQGRLEQLQDAAENALEQKPEQDDVFEQYKAEKMVQYTPRKAGKA